MLEKQAEKSGKVLVELRSLYKNFGDTEVLRGVSFDIHEGEFLSILGPSGCGKSTCLRILAGFESPTLGSVWIDGTNMEGIPPNKRDLCMVFQDYSLFPHMNVFENVAFGLRERREPKDLIREKVKNALELVKLPGFEKRKPHELSGGQKQRVAIARCLVLNPRLLLLDEPLGALDLKLRKQMQVELQSLQNRLKITFVYVTHDQEEALTMSSRIVVFDQGQVQQIGTPFEIYRWPRSRFVADFIGESSFLEGKVSDIEQSRAIIDLGDLRISARAGQLARGQEVILAIRPEDVKLHDQAVSLENRLQGKVVRSSFKGSWTEYAVLLENGRELRALSHAKESLMQPGDSVRLGWNCDDCVVIASAT